MAQDNHLRLRITACIATQDGYEQSEGRIIHPLELADRYMWKLVAQPGWADAYEYAIATNIENPGKNESVITDGMILSGVQTVLGII